MRSHCSGELPQTAINDPHDSLEQTFDDGLESLLTFSASTFDMDAFFQNESDLNAQWQTMNLPSASSLQGGVGESDNDPWAFDTFFAEPATTDVSFDNCDTFDSSLSHLESDGWVTSFLDLPEPTPYPSLEVSSFTGQQFPNEGGELPFKDEGPSTSVLELNSSSDQLKNEVPKPVPPEPQIDVLTPDDQANSRSNEVAVASARNMEDCLIDFHSGVKAPKRKRKEFSRKEKLKVHLVRQVGACQSCRARKVECTADGICDRCFKLAGDPLIAGQICIRHKLKDVYLGVRDVQTRLLTSGKEQVYQLLRALEGHGAKVELRADCFMANFPCRSLPCKVMAVRDKTYLVVPDSLPTVDELDFFGREILLSSPESHSGKITHILDKFLYIYCKQYFGSHLACLCNAAFRITSLNSLVFYGVANIHCHPDGQLDVVNTINDSFSPDTVREQVRLRASEGLEEAEKYFFSEIENLCKKSGGSKQTRMIAGICLLRLMLFYRERVVRIELRSNLPRCETDEDLKNCIHPGRTDPQKRSEQCGFMYKQLAVAFSTLCRGDNTPLTTDWEVEAAGRVAPDVPMLANTFWELKLAYAEFCKNNLTHREDKVFKTLIVEPAEKERERLAKKQSKPPKARKQPKG
ncbi:hypothetical protein DSL72_002570 [Monilinia vaccinii-corymbosi]|uniref:Uncharacterized protein n=1 Tax=Monilinia vaccinii-corymbosi TaxID=61207 RepID=A0A8A3PD23_9HELO|nr:hypothetical protein DSL72_002570 [Monilinia vaccinii-corymbosi]